MVSFGPYETKKKKGSSAQPLREKIARELIKKAEPRYLGISRNLGSSRYAARDQVGLRQLKGACPWIQRTRADMSHQPPNDAKKGRWLGNQHFMKRSLVPWGTQGDGPWRKVAGDLSAW